MRTNLYPILPILFMAPTIVLGIVTMYYNDVSSVIWLQNLVVFILVGICSFLILLSNRFPKINNPILILLGVILILLTFLDSGVDNVHRYVSIGPIHLNMGSIVLPVLLIALEKIAKTKNWWFVALITLGIILILFFQPDASKVTAFSIASIFFLSKYITKNIQYVMFILLIGVSILAWYHLDNLPPVAYVEEILSMTHNLGTVFYMSVVVSLLLLPLPFFLYTTERTKPIAISLGIYFIIVLLSTFFGNFPVPLLGYGVSPIIGYSMAITWLFKSSGLTKEGTYIDR